MRIRLDLDDALADRLIEQAVAARRPIGLHAEVLLRRAVGLPNLDQAPATIPLADADLEALLADPEPAEPAP